MANGVTLSAAQRTNIATLNDIKSQSDTTTTRLATGKKVNSVIDDATAYFTAKGLTDRAGDFLGYKSKIDQGVSNLTAAVNSIDAISDILSQMKGLAEASKSQTQTERATTTTQFNSLGEQIGLLVKDSSYNGLNMLDATSNKLEVRFSDKTNSKITVGGYDLAATATGSGRQIFSNAVYTAAAGFGGIKQIMSVTTYSSFTNIGDNNSNISFVDSLITHLDQGVLNLRSFSAGIGSNISLLQTRSDFSQSYSDTLNVGADKLTLADMNEEGAKLTALQTSQQVAMQSLRISGQQANSVLILLQG